MVYSSRISDVMHTGDESGNRFTWPRARGGSARCWATGPERAAYHL